MGTPISVQARDSVEAALQYEMGRGFVTGSKLFFVLDVPHVRASSAVLDGRTSRTSRRSHDTRYSFPHDPRTIEFRSLNIPCWPFLSRETQVLRLNSSPR